MSLVYIYKSRQVFEICDDEKFSAFKKMTSLENYIRLFQISNCIVIYSVEKYCGDIIVVV